MSSKLDSGPVWMWIIAMSKSSTENVEWQCSSSNHILSTQSFHKQTTPFLSACMTIHLIASMKSLRWLTIQQGWRVWVFWMSMLKLMPKVTSHHAKGIREGQLYSSCSIWESMLPQWRAMCCFMWSNSWLTAIFPLWSTKWCMGECISDNNATALSYLKLPDIYYVLVPTCSSLPGVIWHDNNCWVTPIIHNDEDEQLYTYFDDIALPLTCFISSLSIRRLILIAAGTDTLPTGLN